MAAGTAPRWLLSAVANDILNTTRGPGHITGPGPDRAGLHPSTPALARRIQAGDVLVLDVRPAAEYAAGHITGAVGIPHDELSARLSELRSGTEIVAYCRGRYCVMAPEAVRILRRHGYAARPLQDGLPEWRRAGLPVTTMAAALPASGAVG